MRLTPLDIRKQEFSRGMRGFDSEEVQAFLQMVSEQWEELLDENRRRDEKIRDLENKMAHYEKVEEALQEALQTARETARKSRENAEERAALLLDQAESKAQEIKRDAEHERHQIKREAAKLSGRRSEIVTRLRAFLMSELELLARYEGDDPGGLIRLLPGETERMNELSDRLSNIESAEGPASSRRRDTRDAGLPSHIEEFGERRTEARDKSGAWTAEESGREPAAEAQEPERHVRDWTQSDSTEREIEDDRTAPTGEYHQSEAFQPREDPESGSFQAESFQTPEREWSEEESTHRDDEYPHPSFRESDEPHGRQEGGEADYGRGEAERQGPAHDEGAGDDDDFSSGQGWTTQTMVSGPAEHGRGEGSGEEDVDESEDRTTSQASSEEIEKIRRILSDLE